MKMRIGIPTLGASLPTFNIGTVCADCAAAWTKTFKGKGNIVFIVTDEVLDCDECEGEELTAELSSEVG